MVFEEILRQKGEKRFLCLRKFCFFTVHMSKTVDFNRFTTVHIFNLRNNRLWYVNPLWIVAKPLWTIVNHCKATSAHISWIYSQGQKQKIWFLWVATVPENCCIVSDSLCHARLLLLSSITGFIISKVTQTNSADQNLHGHKFRSLLCRFALKTWFAVF